MAVLPAREAIIVAAERLYARHGIEGVSLRQIGAAAGNANNSAVQYHFGSKDQLIQAIFGYREPRLRERRAELTAERRPEDLAALIECHVLPILEQGAEVGSNYLSFIAMLQQHGHSDVFDRVSTQYRDENEKFRDRVRALLPDLPEPLRTHRVAQALSFAVHAAALNEQAAAAGRPVLPFEVHVRDVLDGLVGFLTAPASPAAIAAIADLDTHPGLSWPLPH
ncbi:TetR/AcrR family transcriptional regulator [Nocardia aurantia]|uniref:TetR family transcriptional regulator n=1 Tax=Nocardia aurantia TaxID=2585199 RepID=A0A7K0DPM6_9NOCA|nr:TetR/AcrR family transcriptional regulator [Nocardia aurantia]MQY27715.1 hypothetical protein [Nocardia aurantia]